MRALFFDLDGTLLDHKHALGAANREVIAEACERGIEVVLASGRTTLSMRPYYEALGLTTPLVSYNGARIWYPGPEAADGGAVNGGAEGGEVEELGLTPAQLAPLIALSRTGALQLNLYDDDHWYTERPKSAEALRYMETSGLTPTAIDLDEAAARGAVKALFIAPAETLAALRGAIEEALPAGAVELTSSMRNFLEVLPAGVNKGRALRTVAARLGIALEETVAFGDGLNDLELLETAGWGVAMENAHPQLKAIADEIAPHHDEDGVARYLRQRWTGVPAR